MIGINAVLLSPFAGGVATYIRHLIKEYDSFLSKNKIRIYYSNDQFQLYKDQFKFQSIQTPLSSSNPFQRVLIENFYWNRKLKGDNIKLFHSPFSYLPFHLSQKSVVTVHDLRVYRFPETYAKARRVFLEYAIKHSIQNATEVISVSKFTKDEIIDIFKIPSNKVSVIYEGIDSASFKRQSKNSDLRTLKKFEIYKPYVLTVGHLEPRKNFLRLIKAFEIFLKETHFNYQLVISGKKNFKCKSILNYIECNKIKKNIVITDFVSASDLLALYRNAQFFVFPSIYEGFGFPPLESLASGVPVIASNKSSIPEILGDAAVYFDPYSIEDMADKMLCLKNDKKLKKDILKQAEKLLEKFSWTDCAKKTIDVYKKVLDQDL